VGVSLFGVVGLIKVGIARRTTPRPGVHTTEWKPGGVVLFLSSGRLGGRLYLGEAFSDVNRVTQQRKGLQRRLGIRPHKEDFLVPNRERESQELYKKVDRSTVLKVRGQVETVAGQKERVDNLSLLAASEQADETGVQEKNTVVGQGRATGETEGKFGTLRPGGRAPKRDWGLESISRKGNLLSPTGH